METRVLSTNDPSALDVALEVLRRGGVVAFPTDTVYGVGAHAFQPEAVQQLYVAKNRPIEKAIPLLIASVDDLSLVAAGVSETARRLAARFWPGGLTLVVSRHPRVPDAVSSDPTVAVRMPDHSVPLALIASLGAPLAATSANLSGQPSPTTADQVADQLRGCVALILDGGPCPGGVSSTVVDVTVDPPVVLRHGAVSAETIQAALQNLWESDLVKERIMRVAIGSDHAGFPLKLEIVKHFNEAGQGYHDFGTYDTAACDYPDFAQAVAEVVARGEYDRGILVCGTGIGMSIAANKVPGIRAALCHDIYSARQSRKHNGANVLCLGTRIIGVGLALEITEAWLETPFSQGERHLRRNTKIAALESK
jgi:tRNA threonylcarbamoyl adenosine modification protein (Sua5/YciO/YrdC/YwlC family)/ribose 5-phosphate isomerase B